MGIDFVIYVDIYGYIMIFLEMFWFSKCWDLLLLEMLKYDVGGDLLGIVLMVRWIFKKYNVNFKCVFSMGILFGVMMINVLLGVYFDFFVVGFVWVGVFFGCYFDVGGMV